MASYDQSPQDEGYSEDPLTVGTVSSSANMQNWISSLPISQRTEYVMGIIDQLPTSQVCEIVRRVRPRLYIDFFQYLPPEVCLKILGFLDPLSLINTARASREWMLLALDRKLWEQLYYLEGFRVIKSEVERFEEEANIDRSRSGTSDGGDEPSSKRRATPQRILPTLHVDGDSEMLDADTPVFEKSLFGSPVRLKTVKESKDVDEDMIDLRLSPQGPSSPQYPSRSIATSTSLKALSNQQSFSTSADPARSPLLSMSRLAIVDRGDKRKKLNWQYLYSQRRRLEANWESEKYVNFQLPHPDHRNEAHQECIYTIQHHGKYLVSGSRDRTLRIWNLDTRRLVHPAEDLIVSGSSDSTVILWKFSTGQIIQRLRKAHRESVLNVRFDKRVLVTCSKDKTIKIFNRRPLHPGELGYPDLTQAVHPVPTYLNNYGFNPTPTAGIPIKPAYTMIGCLEGHGAAVNAVQIYGDEIVSASGDRLVKIWNWPEQKCIRTLVGHTKGIACVQYDGRRVVSGSSDNEVKVFDKASGLEVASLRAHTNLVRTVQAGFGDLPYSEEEDKEAAIATDIAYFEAVDKGEVSRTGQLKGRPRNAGSRKPQDITAYGAELPPGGGGGKFGRIVSGSYDETIIIWRRDKEGVWRAQHTLRQEEAAHIAARIRRPIQANSAIQNPPQTATTQAPPQLPEPGEVDAPNVPFPPGSQAFYHHIINTAIASGPTNLRHTLQAHPQILSYPRLQEAVSALPPSVQPAYATEINAMVASLQQLPGGHSSSTDSANSALSGVVAGDQPNPSSQSQSSTATVTPAAGAVAAAHTTVLQGPVVQTPAAIPTQAPAAGQATAAPPAPAAPHAHHGHHLPANMARVFKLQFDARRIICCSQTSVIVGWDFANNDEAIIEASRLFAPVE
ncbi:F-box WD repeat-containing 1A [Hyphodiscus hymeniophilus]|uniref:F-box WD repeat-containing 1A n=1 Tax=Hyphodiscus hymeniophilus TaxID=353542 RepID=A0A9P6VR99_9HELO|nr:F-box WD repeat-containing 1A [Hyphodiscus hymeniophilus]